MLDHHLNFHFSPNSGRLDLNENLADELIALQSMKCPLCLEPFREPKVLACFHSFCKPCLERQLESSEKVGFSFVLFSIFRFITGVRVMKIVMKSHVSHEESCQSHEDNSFNCIKFWNTFKKVIVHCYSNTWQYYVIY